MTYFEKLEELKSNTSITPENFRADYKSAQQALADALGEAVCGLSVECKAHGTGTVTSTVGNTIEDLIAEVSFVNETKRFSVDHMINCAKFIRFAATDEAIEMWNATAMINSEFATEFDKHKEAARLLAIEAEKKAEADKKAEERYEQLKKKAVFDFNNLANRAKDSIIVNDDFYYALGWLAKHIGSISAALPDYLAGSFTKHFGDATNARIVDSKKKTVNGNAMQWTFGFKATVHQVEVMPVTFVQYLSSTGKHIANTAFIWDLVSEHGFQFGKEQDVNKIKSTVPEQYIDLFEAGFAS